MKWINLRQLLIGLFFAGAFGAAFLIFTEIGQPSLLKFTGGSDCCDRCSNYLYDSDQPVLALSAGVAFLCCFFVGGKILGLKYIAKIIGLCWLSFQIYTVWTAWHLLLRTPCTALYSPGPIFIIGIFVVIIVLLIESSIWAGFCSVPILLMSLIRKLITSDEVTEISLKDS